MVIMPLLAYAFTPVVNDEAKAFAILIQVNSRGLKRVRVILNDTYLLFRVHVLDLLF